MSENLYLRRLLPWLLVCLCGSLYSGVVGAGSYQQSVVFAHQRLRDPAEGKRERLRRVYTAEIGVREATGKNDGPRIREYLRYTGLGEGYAWCAAFVCWSLGEAGMDNPKNAWSPALFPAKRTVWKQDRAYTPQALRNKEQGSSLLPAPSVPAPNQPQQGDVFGIYYSSLKRIAHCGFVDSWDGTWCITVEGNTGPDHAITRDGDPANPIRAGPAEGVYRKRRPVRTIHAVADWTNFER